MQEKQILIIYAVTNGYVDDYSVDQVSKYEKELYSFFDSSHSNLLDEIRTEGGEWATELPSEQVSLDAFSLLVVNLIRMSEHITLGNNAYYT